MNPRFATTSVFLALFWISVLPSYDGHHRVGRRRLEYNPSMTSMWMMDRQGKPMEMFLSEELSNDQLHISVEDNVNFYLYTREHDDVYQIYQNDSERLESSTFNLSRPTKVLIHGFDNTYLSEAEQEILRVYLTSRNVNVVAVDWGALAKAPWYNRAVYHVKPVGQQVAQMIDFLVSAGADVRDFHLIGHSLGAHVASFAANFINSGNITRITGLDPALPLFSRRPAKSRLDPTDADTVDCIHTCGGYLGYYVPLCTHDFYPNGGKPSQPGCGWDITGGCSHGRSYQYFSVTIDTNFTATSCSSVTEIKKKNCSGIHSGFMGEPADQSEPGLYYLETSKIYPYVKY